MYCPACGAATASEQRFCSACGTPLKAEPPTGVRKVGQYRLDREIARGGMGIVYDAYDEKMKRRVALKVLLGEFAENPEFRARFVQESRAAAALDHPSILPVFDAGEQDGMLYIASRLVDGEDLAQHLKRCGTLSTRRALAITGQIAAALDYSHRRGIVHRDVKPANVLLVGGEGEGADHAYLIDFGITTTTSRDMRLTATDQFVGTPEYVSPEQLDKSAVDGRADQYALACVLFRCLAGSSPFERADLRRRHARTPARGAAQSKRGATRPAGLRRRRDPPGALEGPCGALRNLPGVHRGRRRRGRRAARAHGGARAATTPQGGPANRGRAQARTGPGRRRRTRRPARRSCRGSRRDATRRRRRAPPRRPRRPRRRPPSRNRRRPHRLRSRSTPPPCRPSVSRSRATASSCRRPGTWTTATPSSRHQST